MTKSGAAPPAAADPELAALLYHYDRLLELWPNRVVRSEFERRLLQRLAFTVFLEARQGPESIGRLLIDEMYDLEIAKRRSPPADREGV